jgi:hypothetical protein
MLESHAEASISAFADMFDSVWHTGGLLWRRQDASLDAASASAPTWFATTAADELATLRAQRSMPVCAPALLSMAFGDERTALVKVLGSDGRERFMSLLRVDDLDAMTHDGWQIVREVVGPSSAEVVGGPLASSHPKGVEGGVEGGSASSQAALLKVLEAYLDIEHGDGPSKAALAASLFAGEHASVLSVGSAEADEPTGVWTAPAGSLHEVSVAQYLEQKATQQAHAPGAAAYDSIGAIDMLPCRTIAAATVHVGNGERSRLSVDHLILAYGDWGTEGRASDGAAGEWRILSKTSSPRPWPQPPAASKPEARKARM